MLFRFKSQFSFFLLLILLLCGWRGRNLLETSYPLPASVRSEHLIRVQVGEAHKSFGVSSAGPYVVESRNGILAQGGQLKWTGIEAKGGGIRFGNKIFHTNSIFIRSPRGPGIRFNQRLYLNGLEMKLKPGGKILIINYIDLENY